MFGNSFPWLKAGPRGCAYYYQRLSDLAASPACICFSSLCCPPTSQRNKHRPQIVATAPDRRNTVYWPNNWELWLYFYGPDSVIELQKRWMLGIHLVLIESMSLASHCKHFKCSELMLASSQSQGAGESLGKVQGVLCIFLADKQQNSGYCLTQRVLVGS